MEMWELQEHKQRCKQTILGIMIPQIKLTQRCFQNYIQVLVLVLDCRQVTNVSWTITAALAMHGAMLNKTLRIRPWWYQVPPSHTHDDMIWFPCVPVDKSTVTTEDCLYLLVLIETLIGSAKKTWFNWIFPFGGPILEFKSWKLSSII
jgi:hypothetical protein